jgi:hypothetical protein
VAKVLTFGAEKYDIDNWKHVSNGEYRYRNAALRHINDYVKGEKTDPESGCNHLAHAICCLMFILDADESGQALAPAEAKFDVPKMNYAFTTPPEPTHITESSLEGAKGAEYYFLPQNVLASPTQGAKGTEYYFLPQNVLASPTQEIMNYNMQNRSAIPLSGVAIPVTAKYDTIPVRTGLGGKVKQ